MLSQDRLLERFLRYVRIHTTSRDDADCYPSSAGQWELGKLLCSELQSMGIGDAVQDEHGLVWATVPATLKGDLPVVAFNAHLDTSPETSGDGVTPQVIHDYSGGDLCLPGIGGRVIEVAENPELNQLHGQTLVTSDGTTLLGGDDKAGLAIIMELAETLMENSQIAHGPIRILFTCDEEIGHGVDYVDLDRLGADVAYTLDGAGANDIDVATFSADLAVVTIRGVNIHPSIAKDRMVNAIRAAGAFAALLPREQSPEATSGQEGFLHPYVIEGGVAEVTLKILLRDFETDQLSLQGEQLRQIAAEIEAGFPGIAIAIDVRSQYRNMADGLTREPRAVSFAVEAHRRLGRTARLTTVRGGTDGSQLTERGLATPNLSSGQHNPHSPLEWVSLDEMAQAVEVTLELVQIWAEQASPGEVTGNLG
ncbi:MAG: peptidase T [Planctomycetaceae bacterium]|nr:peptidase T [Planctomycetaceae bacterium]